MNSFNSSFIWLRDDEQLTGQKRRNDRPYRAESDTSEGRNHKFGNFEEPVPSPLSCKG